jgi:hypothetical protein
MKLVSERKAGRMVTWHVRRGESQASILANFLRDAAEFGEVFGRPDDRWISDFKSYNNDRHYANSPKDDRDNDELLK